MRAAKTLQREASMTVMQMPSKLNQQPVFEVKDSNKPMTEATKDTQ